MLELFSVADNFLSSTIPSEYGASMQFTELHIAIDLCEPNEDPNLFRAEE